MSSLIFDCHVYFQDRESFHCAIGSILFVAQFFGLMPLAGIRSESPKKLAMNYFSPRAAYTFAVIVMLFGMSGISIAHMIQTLRADTFSIHGNENSITGENFKTQRMGKHKPKNL